MIRTPVLWAVVGALGVGLWIQIAQWRKANATAHAFAQTETAAIDTRYQHWRDQVEVAKGKRERLESQVLYREPTALLPQIAQVAAQLSVAVKAVETPTETNKHGYTVFPITITCSGRYEGLTALVAVIERIQPTPRIDDIRIYRRKRADELWLTLSLAMMTRDGAGQRIGIPPLQDMTHTRPPLYLSATSTASGQSSHDKITPLPKLIAILWDENTPVAILKHLGNLHTVGVGTSINGATVINIEPQKMILEQDGKPYQIPLWTNNPIQVK